MRKASYLCFMCLFASTTQVYADVSFLHDNLLAYTESTTLTVESPFLSSTEIKLAAVHPMVGDNSITFKAPKARSCSAGYENYNGKCVKKCDRATYPLTSQPSTVKGTFSSCTGVTTYYGYTSCNTGWVLKDHKCVESACSGYPYDEQPSSSQGTVISCKAGEKTYYKYTFCNNGWNLSSGTCVPQSCSASDYPYQSDPG
ncbi:MAG: hypothetical protein IJ660_00130, partial [Alphaproteobacteria bacterium]|nr:hypothetical protein [Alphaproteobacteria bacterium]